MLVRDIKPPIQRVIYHVSKKTTRYYQRVRLFTKTSKYGIPVIAITILLLGVSIVAAIPDDKRNTVFYPSAVTSSTWGNKEKIKEVDLGDDAELNEFNNLNSAYLYFSDLLEEPESEVLLPEESNTTEEVIEEILEEPLAYFLNLISPRFTTRAQEENPTPSPDTPQEEQATEEPSALPEEMPPAETNSSTETEEPTDTNTSTPEEEPATSTPPEEAPVEDTTPPEEPPIEPDAILTTVTGE